MDYKTYPKLLSPFKVGNKVLRNRVIVMPTGLHALQGSEPAPTEAVILDAARRAKGGAAVVCVTAALEYDDDAHIYWDWKKPVNQHYLAAAAEAIRFYGAIPSFEIGVPMNFAPGEYYDCMEGLPWRNGITSKMADRSHIEKNADMLAEKARVLKYLGYEMCHVHMAYGTANGAYYFSPHSNHRTDEFGGSAENRCRYANLVLSRVKEAAGKDFLVELRVSGAEPQYEDGLRTDDWVEMSKYLKENVDFLTIHSPTKEFAHVSCFLGSQPYVPYAEAIKKGGCEIPVCAMGGLQDLDEMEEILADGKADLISMTRGIIADPDLLVKAYEGRGEDVRPCIKCIRCHDSGCRDGKTYVCSVNPEIGIEHRLAHMVNTKPVPKKVAVIGGGPAGMEAALRAASQGHDVTLYEKTDKLGGQLNFADYASFKFALKKYKNYLIRQTEKSNVRVLMNTAATPELLASEHYDHIIAALGGVPMMPRIPGIESENVLPAVNAFGNEDKLGENVIVVGGGQVGCETALQLALCGKKVTILEMKSSLAPDASVLYRGELRDQVKANSAITVITDGRCTSIGKTVTYIDATGKEQSLACDNVVIAAGTRPLTDDALAFYGCATRTQLVGDCLKVGTVETAVRSAYGIAMSI